MRKKIFIAVGLLAAIAIAIILIMINKNKVFNPLEDHGEDFMLDAATYEAEESFSQVSSNLTIENPYTGLAAPENYKNAGIISSEGKTDNEQSTIQIPGINSTSLYEGDALNLPNPSYNKGIFLQYTISEDGNTVYQTGLVESSKMAQWIVSNDLEIGEHNLTAFIQGFEQDDDGNWNALNGVELEFTITLKAD